MFPTQGGLGRHRRGFVLALSLERIPPSRASVWCSASPDTITSTMRISADFYPRRAPPTAGRYTHRLRAPSRKPCGQLYVAPGSASRPEPNEGPNARRGTPQAFGHVASRPAPLAWLAAPIGLLPNDPCGAVHVAPGRAIWQTCRRCSKLLPQLGEAARRHPLMPHAGGEPAPDEINALLTPERNDA
jgi:hypothetical protein